MFKTSESDSGLLGRNLQLQSKWCSVAGHEMHYLEEGSGPVVLAIHGNPTWSFMYRKLVEGLKDSFRVIAPDYIGCGLSDHPRETSFRAIDRVGHLETLLEKLGIERFSLVMHDWGGSIGSMLAARNPARVDKLVYLNTTLTEIESLPEIIKRATTPIVGKILTKYSTSFLRLLVEVGVVKRLPSEIRQCYLAPYRRASDRRAIWDFVADIPFTSEHPSHGDMVLLGEKLHLLAEKRVQIVWGLKDPCFHRAMLSKVAAHFPDAAVCELPEASHLLLEDAPEKAIPVIKAFLLDQAQPKAAAPEPSCMPAPNALYTAFLRKVADEPDNAAVILPVYGGERTSYVSTSFKAMAALVSQYQRGFHGLGLEKGDRVLVLVTPGVDFLAMIYAVMARGATPVLVDPGVGKEKLIACIEDAKPDAFLGSPAAFALRFLRRDLFRNMKFLLAAVDLPVPFARSLRYMKRFSTAPMEPISSDGISLIAFTSGATGTPKGVIFSNEMIEAQLRMFHEVFGLESGRKNLSLLPAFSIFNLAAGLGSVFAPLDQTKPISLDPAAIADIITDLGVDYSFASPTLWRKISDFCVRTGKDFPSLKKVLMAGAPVPRELLDNVQSLLPHGEACTPYGSTEALPVTLATGGDLAPLAAIKAIGGEQGTPVGAPIPGVEVKVIKLDDRAIESLSDAQECRPREIGEIIVRGPNVSASYLHRPDATAKSKIREGGRKWHRMGDAGYMDEGGNLYFCGRKAHAVRSGDGRTWFPVPSERIFNQHPRVRRSALISINGGVRPAIVIEPIEGAWPRSEDAKRRFAAELRILAEKDAVTASIEDFLFHPSFPVDGRHNAKIFRDQLTRWAAKGE